MREKFNKYWGSVEKFNPLLFVAVVLDPRYKLDYVNWSLEEIYDKELAARMTNLVKDTLDDLYKFYSKGISAHKESEEGGDSSKSDALNEKLKGLNSVKGVFVNRVEVWKKHKRAKTNSDQSDLERYLAEDTIDDNENADFDILGWWKSNFSKYRILSLIARDVLAVPVSTVASESCFSTSGRVLDVFRSSLSPKMAEALICSQNWLYPASLNFDEKDFDQFDSTEKIVNGEFISFFCYQSILFKYTSDIN